MKLINGKSYRTISDAAGELGVSAKTLQEWINKEIISRPPEVEYGAGMLQIFPPEYVAEVKRQLDDLRRNFRKRRKGPDTGHPEGRPQKL